jgi:hypothetical protein
MLTWLKNLFKSTQDISSQWLTRPTCASFHSKEMEQKIGNPLVSQWFPVLNCLILNIFTITKVVIGNTLMPVFHYIRIKWKDKKAERIPTYKTYQLVMSPEPTSKRVICRQHVWSKKPRLKSQLGYIPISVTAEITQTYLPSRVATTRRDRPFW